MKSVFFIFVVVCISTGAWCQKKKWHFPSYDVIRTGPYIGIQKGRYFNVECGFERQWKELKFLGSQTTALYGGLNLNLKNGIIGTDIGGWKKLGFLGITYGGAINYRTNFTVSKVGFSPMIGIKLSKFHLQVGYEFLFPTKTILETNEFVISLRYKISSQKKVKKN